MLAEMTTEQWDFWEAADRLGLVPDPWLQTGRLAATFANRIEPILAHLSGSKAAVVQAVDFIPGSRGVRKRSKRMGAMEAEATARARWGKR